MDDSLVDYITALVAATRSHRDVALGASPRGSLALFKAAQAWAAVRGRDYVLPDDIKRLAPVALPHRLLIKPESALRGRSASSIITEILAAVPVPLAQRT